MTTPPVTELRVGTAPCACEQPHHHPKLVVLTGGPGAGKTAVLEMASRMFCRHVALLSESASIIFGGGFPRRDSVSARRAVQRAIFHVQRELERWVVEEERVGLILCDRGTVDGLAYWPGDDEDFFAQVGTTHEAELARYSAVVHLATPDVDQGYNQLTNHLRIESADEARVIDARIHQAWLGHPNHHDVASADSFVDKAHAALALVYRELPECCRHNLPAPRRTTSDGDGE